MKKLATILSVAWIVLAGYISNEWAVRRAALLTNAEIDRCLREYGKGRSSPGDSWTPCWEDFRRRFSKNVSSHWAIAASFAIAPVMLMWTCGLLYGRAKRRSQPLQRNSET